MHSSQTIRKTALPAQYDSWADALIADSQIAPADLAQALRDTAAKGRNLSDVLSIAHDVSPLSVSRALATHFRSQIIDPRLAAPDVALMRKWGAHRCLQDGLLPWRRVGACTVILTSQPQIFARHRATLEAEFGAIRMAVTTEKHLNDVICTTFGPDLIQRAEERVPVHFSCRSWNTKGALALGFGICVAFTVAILTAPALVLGGLVGLAVTILALQTLIKFAAIALTFQNPQAEPHAAIPARLPTISILVPLYKEKEIAGHLLARLQALSYPRECLDVCLVVEAEDETTRAALGVTNLPTWMRTITVPPGAVKTKPRALNYALDFVRGTIVGIYDAEDAPAADQLELVAHHFANRPRNVACLQGVLDYYNPEANWLTRCFTLEYASWFRVILPGFARMGMVVPLGGTTLFFRKDVLEELGCWDAHNVTEDADLGVRLARKGYRTELIATTTEEEANGRVWPWIKQRSRWLKGYAITYGVHMRHPLVLLRELGPWRFIAFQVQFAGTLLGFALAPLLMSLWMIPLGLGHPVEPYMSGFVLVTVICVFLTSELISLSAAGFGAHKAKKQWLIKWAISLHFYFPLAAVAAYKGLVELAWKPFYWDKTSHGVLMPRHGALGVKIPPQPQPPQA